tara:strand:- start:133 stop:279 length:147 start_codon:yes stop_codon:yes gene_type:complete
MKYIFKIDDFELTEDEYDLWADNQLSVQDILDDRISKDEINIYIDVKN